MAGSMVATAGSTHSPRQGKLMNQVQCPTWGSTQEMRPETGLEIMLQDGFNIHSRERTGDKLPKILAQDSSRKQGLETGAAATQLRPGLKAQA